MVIHLITGVHYYDHGQPLWCYPVHRGGGGNTTPCGLRVGWLLLLSLLSDQLSNSPISVSIPPIYKTLDPSMQWASSNLDYNIFSLIPTANKLNQVYLKEQSRPCTCISKLTYAYVRLTTQQRVGYFALSERNSNSPSVTSRIWQDCWVVTT